jgi:hypothetical protein
MQETELNAKQSKTTSAQTPFSTPWKKKLFGKPEQLVFNRNTDGIVTVQLISKEISNDIVKQIGNLFGNKSEPTEKLHVESEKTFTDISVERFEHEKKEIQKLLDKHTSLNSLLKRIENDLKEPSIVPTEIEQRRQALKKMRAEITALMVQIDEAEASPELQAYEELKHAILRMKRASQAAFLTIIDFQKRLSDATIKPLQFEELAKEISQLEESKTSWNKDLAAAKTAFSIEKQSLQNEIEKFAVQMQTLPPEIKKTWEELSANWKDVSKLTSMAQVQQCRQDLAKATAQIAEKYQKGLDNKIKAALMELQTNLNATTPDFPDPEKQQTHLDFRNHVLAYRKNIWMSFNESNAALDLQSIPNLQQALFREEVIDRALVTVLEIPAQEESYMEKFLSFISPLTSMLSPLLSELPPFLNPYHQHALIAEKERFDQTSFFYLEQALWKMSLTMDSLAELIPYDETDALIIQYNHLLGSENLMLDDLHALINEVISYAQTALNSNNDAFDRHAIHAAIIDLQGQKEIFSVIIKTQQSHANTIINKAKVQFNTAFDKNARPSILNAATTAVDEIQPIEDSDYDLKTLSAEWEHARTFASKQLETLKYLESLEGLQKEYQETAKRREKEIAALTGEEKIQAEDILLNLKETIDSLDETLNENIADASLALSHKNTLIEINNAFEPIFTIENQKKEMRLQINREINAFTAYLDQCDKAIDEIQKHYAIDLEGAKEFVKNKRSSITEWKDQGQLPTSYLKYFPASALSTLFYYASSQLSFEEATVTDLSLSDLASYIENLKAVINNHKSELSSGRILESLASLKTFQDNCKNIESHTKNLISGVTVKTNLSGDQQFLIPDGLSTASLNKLQFHNATLTTQRQKNLASQQKKAIAAKPDLKFIYQKLQDDIRELTNILEQSQRSQTVSLLDQIQKLHDHPEKQAVAKRAFIETVTTKMSEHAKQMTDSAKKFKTYPKIQEEAIRQIQRTEVDFFRQLQNSPTAIQYHAEGWHADGYVFSTKTDLDLDSLSYIDFKNYLEVIEKTIMQGNDYIKMVQSSHDRVELAAKKFQEKIKEAETTLKDLNRKDQLIEMQRLKDVVARAEKMKNDYMAASETPEEGLFPLFDFLITPSKNVNPTHAALKLLDGYKKNIGDSISKIEAAIRKSKMVKIMTIPQQLAMNPNGQIAHELRQRFQDKIQPLIDTTRKALESYSKNGKLSVAYTRYVSASSPLMREIENAIDKKLQELDGFEKGYKSGNLLTNPFGSFTPVSQLESSEMEKYFKQLTNLEKMLKEDLNKKFQIDSLIDAQVNYESMLNETVKKQLVKLREKDLFSDAFLLERKIEEITTKEAKWEGRVTQPAQFRDLVTELKTLTREMGYAVDEFNPKKTPSSFEEQIIMLLKRKEQYNTYISQWLRDKNRDILDQIDADISALKTKLAAKIDGGFSKHQNELIALKHDIEEIYSTYNIQMRSQHVVIDTINHEINKFDYEGSKFDTTQRPYVESFTASYAPNGIVQWMTHAQKHVEEMEPEEIAQVRPEKKHQDLIDRSLKEISSTFDYKVIREPHAAYKEALEKAEKAEAALIKKGQIMHAYDLNAKINSIKIKHDVESRIVRNDGKDLRELARNIWDLSSKINAAESNASRLPDMDIADQVEQIDPATVPPHYIDHMKNCIISHIEKIYTDQKESINKSIKIVDKLVKHVELPYRWRETIVNELDKCQEDFERINSEREQLLSEFSINGLLAIQKKLRAEEDKLVQITTKYSLKPLNEQLKSYEKQLSAIESLKSQRIKEFSSTQDLEDLDKNCKKAFKDFYGSIIAGDVQNHIQDLIQCLKVITNNLYKEIGEIKKNPPPTIGQLLQTLPENSPEYPVQKKIIRRQTIDKISEQKKALKSYFKKIDTINEQIAEKTPNYPTLPIPWKTLVESKINDKVAQLERLAYGLPIFEDGDEPKYKSFDDLTKTEILEYESLVNSYTKMKENDKDSTTTVLARLDDFIRLKDIEKYFTRFHKATKNLETTIAKPNILKAKKETLEAIKSAVNQILFSCMENLDTLGDAKSLVLTLEMAQAFLYRAAQENTIHIMNLDSWPLIYVCDKHKDIKLSAQQTSSNAFNAIIRDGFSVGYNGDTPNESCDALSFNKKIEETEKHIEEEQKWCDAFTAFLKNEGLENHPKYIETTQFFNNKIPKIKEELQKLRTEATIKKQGKTSCLKIADIDTFDDLLKYKNHLDKYCAEFFEELNNIKEFGHLTKEERIPIVSNNSPVPSSGKTSNDPDFLDVDPDLSSAISSSSQPSSSSDISQKSSSQQPIETQAPEVQLSSLDPTMEKTINELTALAKTMKDYIKQMSDLYGKDFGEAFPEELIDLSQKNQNFDDAYQKYITAWNKIQNHALKIGKEYSETMNKSFPKERDPFMVNLCNAYNNFMKTPDRMTVNQTLVHVDKLAKADFIRIQLENIAKYSRQIYAFICEADKLEKNDRSVFVSVKNIESCYSSLNKCTNISSDSDLTAILDTLSKLEMQCRNAQKENNSLCNNRKSLHTELEEYEKEFKRKIDFIRKELGVDVYGISTPVEKEIFSLKEKILVTELSPENIERLKKAKSNCINAIETNTYISQGYIAAKKFKEIEEKVTKKIDELCKSNPPQYATAKKLKSDLTLPKTWQINENFDEFCDQVNALVEKLTYSLEDAEFTIDMMTQLEQTVGSEFYPMIIQNIIQNLTETANAITKNCEDLLKDKHPLPIANKLKEIITNTKESISIANNLASGNKDEFISNTNDIKIGFNGSLEIISSIKNLINLYYDNSTTSKIEEKFKKADNIIEELNKKSPKQPKGYFYICKIKWLKENLINSAKTFAKRFESESSSLSGILAEAKLLETEMANFDRDLQKIAEAPRMDIFEQLEMAKIEQVMSEEEQKSIINGIKTYGKELINETLKAIDKYASEAKEFFTEKLISSLLEKIKNASIKLKLRKGEVADVTDPAVLKQWIATIQKEKISIINELESILKLEANKQYLEDYRSVIKEAHDLLGKLETKYPEHEKTLSDAIKKLELNNQAYLQNFTSFPAYWNNFNKEWKILQKVVAHIKDQINSQKT